jgi:hypothetical protein
MIKIRFWTSYIYHLKIHLKVFLKKTTIPITCNAVCKGCIKKGRLDVHHTYAQDIL